MNRDAERAIDVLIVGGGLAGALIGLQLADRRPELSVMILDARERPESGRTWCLFSTDVSPPQWAWLQPLFAWEWTGYDVAFPEFVRGLPTQYACITGDSLNRVVEQRLRRSVRQNAVVIELGPHEAVCSDGTRYRAPLVIDARGAHDSRHLRLRWQKFVGLEVQLQQPHGLTRPLVMDVREAQLEGFRFLYLLPFGPHRVLIEDTRYSDSPYLDESALESAVREYAVRRGWDIAEVMRRERGVLPVVLGGDIAAFWNEQNGAASVGLRGAFFHPTTGYSLPEAVRTAEWLAGETQLTTGRIAPLLRHRSMALWRERRFYRALNRMLFLAAEPSERFRVLQRFYRLSNGLIERFYGGRANFADKLRIVSGRPPVPVSRALRALPESAAAESIHV